jgi:hypothetical protein
MVNLDARLNKCCFIMTPAVLYRFGISVHGNGHAAMLLSMKARSREELSSRKAIDAS